MKTFNDKDGRVWELELTLDSAIRVKDALDIDLLQPEKGDPPLITRLGTDEMFLGRVICTLLGDQFDSHGLSEHEVQQSFDGRTLMAAQTAFYEELVDFFQHRGRADRAGAIAKQAEVISLATKQIADKIDKIDVGETIRGAMSGKLPEPLA